MNHCGSSKILVAVAQLVAVFDDAANLNVRHGEDLGHELDALCLLDELLVRLSGERDDGAVGMDGSALDVFDSETASVADAGKLQFDVAVLLAAIGEDLEAGVDAEHVELVVGGLFAEEIDGGGAGNLGLRGHGELFRSGCGPLRVERGVQPEASKAENSERRRRRQPEVRFIFEFSFFGWFLWMRRLNGPSGFCCACFTVF